MFELEAFVEECRRALAERSPQSAAKEIVARAVSQPGEVLGGLGTPERAGIEPIYQSPELTIVNVIWAPFMTINPHEHRMWAVIGIYGGREDNAFFRRSRAGVGLERAGGKTLVDRDAVVLGDQVIHAVTNPLRTYTGAIHVYGGDFFGTPRSIWETETSPEEPFDPERVKRDFQEADERARRLLII